MSVFTNIARHFIVPTSTKSDGTLFDIEANALLDKATEIHCIVIGDFVSDKVSEYDYKQIPAGLEHLARADRLIGHNIQGYDLPLLEKLYGWRPKPNCTIADTLVAGRLILPHIADLDDQAAAMGDPKLGKLRGSYKLKAWGARLGIPKVGADITDFSVWTPELQARCVSDVALTKALLHFLQPDGYSQQALELEHCVAAICDRIAADGVPFDVAAAERLCRQWAARRAELEAELRQQFPNIKNWNSRLQIIALLMARGWVPEKFTDKGNPSLDEEVLATVASIYPELKGLSEYFALGAVISKIITGPKSCCNSVRSDGRIHNAPIHIRTPHSRAQYSEPNLGGIPNPKKGKPVGSECRTLFRDNNGWVFVACDQASLQDRGYAHYLHPFDGGAYGRAFLAGVDTHWQSSIALGLVPEGTTRDKANKVHEAIRENGGKRFRFAFLYGCGPPKAGIIIYDVARAVQQIDGSRDLQQRFFGSSERPSEAALKRVGGRVLDQFLAATPGLQALRADLKKQAHDCGWLPGLDGRRVPVRALYSALNFQVTSAEAIVCKRWLAQVYDELRERFRYGPDGDAYIVLWVHDEIVVCCRPEIAEQVGEILIRHGKEAGEHYGLKVPLDVEYKIGRSWAGEPLDTRTEPIPLITPELIPPTEPAEPIAVEMVSAAVADLESDVAVAGDDDRLEDSADADDAEDDGDGQLGHVGGIDPARDGGHHDHDELADTMAAKAGVGLVAPIVDFTPAASARAEEAADESNSRPPWTTPILTEIAYAPELHALYAAEMAKVEGAPLLLVTAQANEDRSSSAYTVEQAKPNRGDTAIGKRATGDGRDQDAGGERLNGHNGDYGDRSSEQHAGKPYGPTRIRLITQGYRVTQTFPFLVPGETEPRFFEDRWELKPEITPTKEQPRKTCRYWHRANGQELNDTRPRRIIYNWPAIMAAGPGTNVFITEGANKSKPLNEKGLLATAAPYHQWGPECTAALAGYHLFYLADHCNLLMGWDAHDNDPAARYAEDAKKKLAPRAASFRIVPAAHLWKYLPPGARTIHQGDDVKDWLELGGEPAKLLEICREVPAEGSKNDDPLFWHGEPDPRPRRKWRIKQLMPGVGAGLLSGQWGTYKTFMAIELATTVIAAETQFCGRRLVEPCGVLILATEGAFELRDRIDAAVHNKYPDMAHAPITWRESFPTLLADGAAEQLIKIVQEAAEGCKARFGLPLGLVIIDVLTDAAGYAKAGDENDPAIGAKLMGVFRRAAEACGCFLLAVDHFGKSVEAGTRGTSAKEGSADAILACLGEREVSGTVTNTRLALRKVRGGPQGQEFPYKPRVVSILEPREEDGSETTCVIDWEAAAAAPSDPWESAARQAEAKLAMRALRRAMMKLLAEHGVEIVSEPGAAAIRMVTQELVREEFYANTVADGDSKQKQNVKRQRFHRALARAEDQNLIGRRDIEGTTYLWFINL